MKDHFTPCRALIRQCFFLVTCLYMNTMRKKKRNSVKRLKTQVLKPQAHTSSSSFLLFIWLFSSSEWASFSWRCTSCTSLRARSFCSSNWTLRACVSSLKDTFRESYWQKDGGRQDKTKTKWIVLCILQWAERTRYRLFFHLHRYKNDPSFLRLCWVSLELSPAVV